MTDRTRTHDAALALDASHEAQRTTAFQHDDTETTMDWYCPECCAAFSSSGTCPADDVTLVYGDPDGGS